MDSLILDTQTLADIDANRERRAMADKARRLSERRAARVEREKARAGAHSCDLGQGILFPADCPDLVDLFNYQSGAR